MSWASLDDGFADHRKVLPLSSDAFRLHVCAMCWCNRRGTDGKVVTLDLRILGAMLPGSQDVNALAQELAAAALWDELADGWQLHDFLDWNEPAAKVKAKREAHAKAQKEAREKAREARDKARASARDASHVPARASTHPIPSHPIPESKDSDPPKSPKGEIVGALSPVDTWKAIQEAAGGAQALGLDRNLGVAQPLWLDDNRALLWAQNLLTLSRAKPAPTLADWIKLGRWLGAGAVEPLLPYQQLSKGGAAGNIAGWLKRAADWDGISDPRQRAAPRAPAAPAVRSHPTHEPYIPSATQLEARRLRKEREAKEREASDGTPQATE